jgi:hypothetical protein
MSLRVTLAARTAAVEKGRPAGAEVARADGKRGIKRPAHYRTSPTSSDVARVTWRPGVFLTCWHRRASARRY